MSKNEIHDVARLRARLAFPDSPLAQAAATKAVLFAGVQDKSAAETSHEESVFQFRPSHALATLATLAAVLTFAFTSAANNKKSNEEAPNTSVSSSANLTNE